MATLTLTKSPVRVQSTRQGDDEPNRRSNRPAPSLRATRDDVAAQLAEWFDDMPDEHQARLVSRFRL